jgi:thioesterase domain-containing protein
VTRRADDRSTDDAVLDRLTRALHAQIPVSRFLQIAFRELEADRIVLETPLEPSRNHRGTAFGPSVFTAISLAPWLLLVRRTWSMRLAARILLRKSEFAILRPIVSAYRAECRTLPDIPEAELRAGGRVRLTASSVVTVDSEPAATYTAYFTLLGASSGSGAEGDLELPFPEEWRA